MKKVRITNHVLSKLSILTICLSFQLASIDAQCDVDGIYIDAALLDPNGASNFDTDQDGTAETGDEFVQICNSSSAAIDLSTYSLGDDEGLTALSGSLAAGECLVVMREYSGTPPANFLIIAGFAQFANGGEPIILENSATGNGCVVGFGVDCGSNNPTAYDCDQWPEDSDGVVTAGGVANPNITPTDLGMAPLPIELTKFSVANYGMYNVLNWQTATEINNDRFIIERSSDANRYETIGGVKGEGNSQRLIDYTFTDESPLSGINYYRLIQVDIDGTKSYSDVVSVEMERVHNVRITPTSTFDFITVNTGENSSIIVRSLNGQVMNTQSNTNGNFTVDMANYPQGIYYLTIDINGSVQTEKVVRL